MIFVSVWHVLKQLLTSVLMKALDIYLAALQFGEYQLQFTFTLVN